MYKISLSRNAHAHFGFIEMTNFYKKLIFRTPTVKTPTTNCIDLYYKVRY